MASDPRRRRVEPTDRWEQIELLCGWPEQREYELIRPLVLFGSPPDGRAEETGVASGRTLRRRAVRFEAEGMESLTLEHGGEPLSRYAVRVEANTGELRSVGRPRLFGTSHTVVQPRLFGLDALGEAGWLKAMKLGGYAPRAPRGRPALQEALFRYATAL